jgi:PEP-CTERM motif
LFIFLGSFMMKFQLKALVVALSLAAASVPAQAAVDLTASGNGSFILTLIDRVANVSATFDLGRNYADFNQTAATGFAVTNVTAQGTSFSWNLSQGDYALAWNAFNAAANINNTQYGIIAGDNLGSGVASRGYITTYASLANASGNQVITAVGNLDTYVVGAAFGNLGVANLNTAENGGGFSNPATVFYNGSKNNNTGPVALGLVGTSLGVVQYVTPASSLSPSTFTVFANDAKFSLNANGSLTYMTAPVPEADTWAMMVAGLGLMGFVARRRSRNQA